MLKDESSELFNVATAFDNALSPEHASSAPFTSRMADFGFSASLNDPEFPDRQVAGHLHLESMFSQFLQKSHTLSKVRMLPLIHPVFKIGSLDALISLTDSFSSMEASFDSLLIKCRNNAKTLYSFAKAAFGMEDLDSTTIYVNDEKLEDFLLHFRWNQGKFQPGRTLSEIVDSFSSEISNSDNLVKNHMSEFQTMKSEFFILEKKHSGNLSTKNLTKICREHVSSLILPNSEYIEALLVAVPIDLVDDFLDSYETLTEFVVPRTALEICQDEEYKLFRVFIFSKASVEFRHKCRERKFIPRDLEGISKARRRPSDASEGPGNSPIDDPHDTAERQEEASLGQEEELDQVELYRAQLLESFEYMTSLIKTTYSEIFTSLVHFKIVKILVEDVLRYGLPPNYLTMLILPPPSNNHHSSDANNSKKIDKKALKNTCLEFVHKYNLVKEAPFMTTYGKKKSLSSSNKEESSEVPLGIPSEWTANEYLPFVMDEIKVSLA